MDNNTFNENLSTIFYSNATTAPFADERLTKDDVLYLTVPTVFLIGRYIYCIWYAIGFPGNVISVVIWNTNHMYDVCSTAQYLVTLSYCDILTQFLHIFKYLKIYWRVNTFDTPALCEFWNILYMIPLYIGELLVLGFTVEKLVSLRNPLRSGWFERHQRAPKEIVWIVVSVTVLSFPQAYFWTVDNRGHCDPNRFVETWQYPVWHLVSDSFFDIVIPLSVFVINCIIVVEAKHSVVPTYRQDKTSLHQSTVVLLRLSYYRVITLLPSTVISFMEFIGGFRLHNLPAVYNLDDVNENDDWQKFVVLSTVRLCADMLACSRNAISVLIFMFSSIHFRREFLRRFWRIVGVCYICGSSVVARVTHNLRSFEEEIDIS